MVERVISILFMSLIVSGSTKMFNLSSFSFGILEENGLVIQCIVKKYYLCLEDSFEKKIPYGYKCVLIFYVGVVLLIPSLSILN